MVDSTFCGILPCNIEELQRYRKQYNVKFLREHAITENAVLLGIVQIHLRSEITLTEIHMNGFRLFRFDRSNRVRKVGVEAYIRDNL